MLNSGKKIRALCDKKINILTLVLFEKKFLNETKNHNPSLQVKWSVPKTTCRYGIKNDISHPCFCWNVVLYHLCQVF